jgi:Fanconi-associated nuclease 1
LTFIFFFCKGLGGESLALICECFAKNYSAHSGGMPDLCVWKSGEGFVKFVEVKGQGDRFSDKQRVWIDLLKDCGVAVQEFHVAVNDVGNKRKHV